MGNLFCISLLHASQKFDVITMSFSQLILVVTYIQVFAGLRKNSHGDGTLALPGGHLEMNETWEDCAIRETIEETGLAIHNVKFGHVTNDIMSDQKKHYVTIFMMGECVCSSEEEELPQPKNLEPHKCHGWDSYSWDELKDFASKSRSSNDFGGKNEENDDLSPILFGPLLKLVEESPEMVMGFLRTPP